MGFWFDCSVKVKFNAEDYEDAIEKFGKLLKVSVGDASYAEGGVDISLRYNVYNKVTTVVLSIRSEDGGQENNKSMLDWYKEASNIDWVRYAEYTYDADWHPEVYKRIYGQYDDVYDND